MRHVEEGIVKLGETEYQLANLRIPPQNKRCYCSPAINSFPSSPPLNPLLVPFDEGS